MRWLFAALCLASWSLAGCSYPARIELYNNTGSELGLHLDKEVEGAGWDDKVIRIAAGTSRRLRAGLALNEAMLKVTNRGCDYVFQVPDEMWRDVVLHTPIRLQVDPGLTVYRMPEGRGRLGPNELIPAQRGGFPLTPVTKTCR